MSITRETQVIGVEPRITEAGFEQVLRDAGSPFAGHNGWKKCVERGVDPLFALAISSHESGHGTNPTSMTARYDLNNPGACRNSTTGKGVEVETEKGTFVAYPTVEDGWEDLANRLVVDSKPYKRDHATTVASVLYIWSPPGDRGNVPRSYIADVLHKMNRWMTPGVSVPEAPTDRMIRLLVERGFEVYDVRDALPVNSKGAGAYLYGRIPYSEVKHIIHHWTGDSFSRDTIRIITGTDYGQATISPNMSVEDEIDLLRWYANYHISKDGGTWGGIAYGTLVFPSGRVYVAHDIGTLTYHAFNANSVSYATCCPNANNAAPTPPQLAALTNVWDILANHTPEIPATHANLWGHKEATFIDTRNQTACPGTFLPTVVNFRSQGSPVIADPAPPSDPNNPHPDARRFPETGHWVINDGKIRMLDAWKTFGEVEGCGYPLFGMTLDEDGVYRQIFENVMLEIDANGNARRGGLGQRYKALLEQIRLGVRQEAA